MSGYPIVLEGLAINAVVVGGGRVAERKARTLLESGARVRVVAPAIAFSVRELARSSPRCTLVERDYESTDLSDASLVVAATDQQGVNACVAADARRRGVLVNVVDDGEVGDFVTPAIHRRGDLLVAVTAGGVPAASSRIRDAIAERFGDRYADAIEQLAKLRERLLDSGDRGAWRTAIDDLVGEDFCDSVDSGAFVEKRAGWRF